MSIDTYYFARLKVETMGLIFFLKQLQAASSSGGGEALLGSIVKKIDQPFQTTYVVPQSLDAPRLLLKALEARKEALGIADSLTLRTIVAAGTETSRIGRKNSLLGGSGPFPSIPMNAHLNVDYSRMKSVTIAYGPETYYEYIPMGYLGRLYQAVNGRSSPDMGGGLLTDNAFVMQVLMARNYSVVFEASGEIKSDIDVNIAAFNTLPEVKGKVLLSRENASTLKAEVASPTYYLVALTSAIWKDCRL
jgi:hypothetical protein